MVEGDVLRVKIIALTESPATIPFNYNYALHSAIYGCIEKSSGEYSKYLHDKGFINETVKKRFKLFTFSKLFFTIWIIPVFWIKSMPGNANSTGKMNRDSYIQKLSRIKFERISYYHVFC